MNRLLGYSLLGIGLLGFVFFLNYKGTAIPMKELWFVLSFFIIVAGGYFFAKYKLQKQSALDTDSNSKLLAEIEQLKCTGNKVKVTLDNAELKSRSYKQEIIN